MPQVIDQQFFLWGGVRLSANALPPENHRDERATPRATTAEDQREKLSPGKASGGLEIPIYTLDADTAALLTDYNDGAARPFTWFPKSTDDTAALLYEAHALGHGQSFADAVAMQRLRLEFDKGDMVKLGKLFHDDYGGSGQTGTLNGTSITFTGGVPSGKSMRLHFHAYQVTGGPGNFDGLVESAPNDTYGAPTTRWTLAQTASASVPDDGQTVLVAGPITDPEWRFRITAISAGTWFVCVAGAIVE